MGQTLTEDPGAPAPSPQARWNAAHPKEIWAHAALRSALKKGLIEKEPCGVCGAHEVDGHHHDYDRPMDVRWLCRLHHRGVHRKGGRS
ncbi:hypothetical protein BQ8794_270074 [Mesorhizobium prunaredense]|uniref:Uncharacterized protein n=1 Tax=Mesorhizobium prunaredense TaxID=1631249 RepID=A0A1R3V8N0_9HYPH|nr:hypothetical protein BQ8794_270074 [Mesorhizobium prunaredense]